MPTVSMACVTPQTYPVDVPNTTGSLLQSSSPPMAASLTGETTTVSVREIFVTTTTGHKMWRICFNLSVREVLNPLSYLLYLSAISFYHPRQIANRYPSVQLYYP